MICGRVIYLLGANVLIQTKNLPCRVTAGLAAIRLDEALCDSPAVLNQGPQPCGKTTLATTKIAADPFQPLPHARDFASSIIFARSSDTGNF